MRAKKTRFKRTLAVLLSALLVLNNPGITAYAEASAQDAEEAVAVEEETLAVENEAAAIEEETVSFEQDEEGLTAAADSATWADLQAALDASGTVILEDDYIASDTDGTLVVPAGVEVVLDLNGHTINGAASDTKAKVEVIAVNGTLTIRDTSEGQAGTITGGGETGVSVTNGGKLTLEGGSITGNVASSLAGGVYVGGTNSEFTMTGGSISGNEAGDYGGGVYVGGGGHFTMTGGSISGNTVHEWFGGGVCIERDGYFTMDDGSITNNVSDYWGGGVCALDYGTFTMNGGEISGNRALNDGAGGGVLLDDWGIFTMNDGSITNNVAGYGGGVYAESDTKFNMKGGGVTNNTASEWGGGIYSEAKELRIAGEVSGNSANKGGGVFVYSRDFYLEEGGTITGNTANSDSGGVFCNCIAKMHLTGGTITGNTVNDAPSNLFLRWYSANQFAIIEVENAVAEGTYIGINGSEPTVDKPLTITDGLPGNGDAKRIFTSDQGAYVIRTNEDGEAILKVKSSDRYNVTLDESAQGKVYVVSESDTPQFAEDDVVEVRVEEGVEPSDLKLSMSYTENGDAKTEPLVLGENGGCTFTMPTAHVTISAVTKKVINVTQDANLHGTVTADKDRAFPGDTVTLTTQADFGYTFAPVVEYGNGKSIEYTDMGSGQYSFEVPTGDYSEILVSGTYTPKTPPVGGFVTGLYVWDGIQHGTVTATAGGGIVIPHAADGSDGIDVDTTEVTLTAIPDAGYVLKEWRVESMDPDTWEPDGLYVLPVVNSRFTIQRSDFLVFRINAIFEEGTQAYNISVQSTDESNTGSKITVDKAKAFAGDLVTITADVKDGADFGMHYRPNEGAHFRYLFARYQVRNETSMRYIDLTESADGKTFTFRVPDDIDPDYPTIYVEANFVSVSTHLVSIQAPQDPAVGVVATDKTQYNEGAQVTTTITVPADSSFDPQAPGAMTVTYRPEGGATQQIDLGAPSVETVDDKTVYTFTFNMPDADVVIAVNFDEKAITITDNLTSGKPERFIKVNGIELGAADNKRAKAGDAVEVSIDAHSITNRDKYAVKSAKLHWTEGGTEKEKPLPFDRQSNGDATVSFTMPDSDVTVELEMERAYKVNLTPSEMLSTELNKVFAGETVTVTAIAPQKVFWTLKNERGKNVPYDGGADTTITFTMPESNVNVSAVPCDYVNIPYVSRSWSGEVVSTNAIANDANAVVENTSLGSGFYYVENSKTIEGRIVVSGDAKLIIADGATLTAKKGIEVVAGTTLTIYGQTAGTGKIIATGNKNNAGIGGSNTHAGTINIHGGEIKATGGQDGAGIGGGADGNGGTVRIYGGKVTANGSHYAAGIGGGNDEGKGSTITIYGGEVTATGGGDAAGIGGAEGGNGGDFTIYGGKVTATGGNNGAGIGGGEDGHGGIISIYGGDVHAKGGGNASAIGGGDDADGGTINIEGGTITTESRDGAGIGGGEDGDGGNITIRGGIFNLDSGNGAGIGGGNHAGDGGRISIYDGNFTIHAGHGAGIGGGRADDGFIAKNSGDGGTIRIYGGTFNIEAPASYGIGAGGAGAEGGSTLEYTEANGTNIGSGGNVRISGGEFDITPSIQKDFGAVGGDTGSFVMTGGTITSHGNYALAYVGNCDIHIYGGELNGWGIITDETVEIKHDPAQSENSIQINLSRDESGFKMIDADDSLTLGNDIKVEVGTALDSVSAVKADNRVKALEDKKGNTMAAVITICDHAGSTFDITDETHTQSCPWCKTTFEAEEHEFDADGVCTVCGYHADKLIVTFDPDNGETAYDVAVLPDDVVARPADPTKAGFDFQGWFQVIDGELAEAEFDFNTPIVADIDLKAKWSPLSVYTVILNPGDASGDPITITSENNWVEVFEHGKFIKSGDTVSFCCPMKPDAFTAPEGKEFVGWTMGGDSTVYEEDSLVDLDGTNCTLTAQWAEPHNITWATMPGYAVWPSRVATATEEEIVPAVVRLNKAAYDSGTRLTSVTIEGEGSETIVLTADANGTAFVDIAPAEGDDHVLYAPQFAMPAADVTVTANFEGGVAGITCAASLSLNERIGVNLYVNNLPSNTNPSNYTVEYWPGDEGDSTTVELESQTKNYIRLADFAAAEMSIPAHARVYYQGSLIKSIDVSVRDYCDNRIDNSTNAELKKLCQATLDYGTYAQILFDRSTDDPANKNHPVGTEERVAAVEVPQTFAASSSGTCSQVKSVAASVSLESQVALNLYIKPKSGVSADDILLKVDGLNLPSNGSIEVGTEATATRTTLEDGRIFVTVVGIAAKNLDQIFTFTIGADGDTKTVTCGPLCYAYNKQSGSNAAVANVCKALYAYHVKAKAYLENQD